MIPGGIWAVYTHTECETWCRPQTAGELGKWHCLGSQLSEKQLPAGMIGWGAGVDGYTMGTGLLTCLGQHRSSAIKSWNNSFCLNFYSPSDQITAELAWHWQNCNLFESAFSMWKHIVFPSDLDDEFINPLQTGLWWGLQVTSLTGVKGCHMYRQWGITAIWIPGNKLQWNSNKTWSFI